ncbi:hypothetical protein [Aeoliella sp. SH292]|uniref:hypothetical protein n=1 Tax=Aeoliella sp. SH292 TaxID=3454464 RepID=UPI003F949270
MRKDTRAPAIRQKVLCLIRQDVANRPYVEIYCGDTIDVKIATLPYVGTKRGELLAEEVVAHQLPRCYADLMESSPRAHDVVGINSVSATVDRRAHRQLLRGLDTVAKPAEETRLCVL